MYTYINVHTERGCFLSDRYHTGLTHIQTVLTEVLAKQHLLKDNLIQKSRFE